MRQVLSFYWKCFKLALFGATRLANNLYTLVGSLILAMILRAFGYEVIIASDLLSQVGAMGIIFAATWLVIFLIRALFIAPFKLFKECTETTSELNDELRSAEARLSEAAADPDLTIISNSAPSSWSARQSLRPAAGL